jgi:hypothetical protein
MKPGQGFAKRVTPENIGTFKPLLATITTRAARARRQSAIETDDDLKVAEALFAGVSFLLPTRRLLATQSGPMPVPATADAAASEPLVEILFAEIPRSGLRWRQANFRKDLFTRFFHAAAGEPIVLEAIDAFGAVTIEPPRTRVSVESNNHRIELGQAQGDYPQAGSGRPIAIFMPTAVERRFRYMLLMPGSESHSRVANSLSEISPDLGNRTRQLLISRENAERIWPESPLWNSEPS